MGQLKSQRRIRLPCLPCLVSNHADRSVFIWGCFSLQVWKVLPPTRCNRGEWNSVYASPGFLSRNHVSLPAATSVEYQEHGFWEDTVLFISINVFCFQIVEHNKHNSLLRGWWSGSRTLRWYYISKSGHILTSAGLSGPGEAEYFKQKPCVSNWGAWSLKDKYLLD